MTKPDGLKHLPPAAQVALIRPEGVEGALMVKRRYVQKPYDERSLFVHPSGELWGVPYEVWKQHESRRPIRLWEWHGTGEGMIGGPTKREADFTFFGGLWEFPEQYSAGELLAHAKELEDWLADERYEFSHRCRASVEEKIKRNRMLAGIKGWDEMGRSWRWGHALGLGGPAILATCDDSEL